ncbi:MAG: hypothetical protein GWP91_18905 [Rhodobacterales bacterium]|nr:hypothetical protein [Rhodobacterales bacterium]
MAHKPKSFTQRYLLALVVAAIIAANRWGDQAEVRRAAAEKEAAVIVAAALPDRDAPTEVWDQWSADVLRPCQVEWRGWSTETIEYTSLTEPQTDCLLVALKVHAQGKRPEDSHAKEVVLTRLLQGQRAIAAKAD